MDLGVPPRMSPSPSTLTVVDPATNPPVPSPSAGYDVKDQGYFDHARVDIHALLPPFASRVLEIGCGRGSTLAWLKNKQKCHFTMGIELFEEAAQHARAHVDEVLTGDAERLVESLDPRQPFDLILCLDVLEHLVDPWTFVDSLSRVLIPSGNVVASIPNIRHVRVSVPLLLAGRWAYDTEGILDRTHLRFFTRETAIELLSRSQLRVDRVEHGFIGTQSGSARLNRFTLGRFKDLLASQYLLRARKLEPSQHEHD